MAAYVPGPAAAVAAEDVRGRSIRRLDDRNPVPDFHSLQAWRDRAEHLRHHILVSAGLWPPFERIPLRPKVWGRLKRSGYSVDKVAFQSVPGLLVTGNVYRPANENAVHPAVLNPHGHWHDGRLQHNEVCSEPVRCINLALQGYTALSYDMIGYIDSRQLSHEFGNPRADLWGLNLLGLQLWNSIRALDFLAGLPGVDANRLAVTGASGGATQAMLLAAVDKRVSVVALVNMVSTCFQGGCLCENAPGLRLDTTNVEIAALVAPRPLLLVSASGDWTSETAAVEYPALQALYRMYGAEERIGHRHLIAEHNYNRASREAVYAFFHRWLQPGSADVAWAGQSRSADPMREQTLRPEPAEELRLFPVGAAKLPTEAREKRFAARRRAALAASLRLHWPNQSDRIAEFQAMYGPAFADLMAASWPRHVVAERLCLIQGEGYTSERLVLGRPSKGDRIPALWLEPVAWSGPAVLALHGRGMTRFMQGPNQQPGEFLRRLLVAGWAILAIDVFDTGDAATSTIERAAFHTTYNRLPLADRVQDILTALATLRQRAPMRRLAMVGAGQAGLWCLLARPLAPYPLVTVADMARFDEASDEAYLRLLFVPGLKRIGGLATAVALAAPVPTLLHNMGGRPVGGAASAVYQAIGASEALAAYDAPLPGEDIVAWLDN